ncbi:MAG: hypothetical protein V2J25_02585 [Desulfatiglans sp.]|jgi:hypothetical protein|nr:hypothetical protein [Thermodesulfobacteriota bacterium]MEE4351732.1 hypothetical protein [Desulfatiglans sp.]
MDRNEILKKIWPKVRRKHFFPEIPMPVIEECDDRVAIAMRNKQIILNPAFFDQLDGQISDEEVIEGLLDHGISHYTYCPWDFKTHLSIYTASKKVIKDKAMAKMATRIFTDVVADTHCVKEIDTPLPSIYRHLKKGVVENFTAALYQSIWGMDLRAKGHAQIPRNLKSLPYLAKKEWEESAKKFARAIESFLLDLKKAAEKSLSNQPGDAPGNENPTSFTICSHDLDSFSPEEIEAGLKEFAENVEDIEEFKESVGDILEELEDAGYPVMGRGKGKGLDADILYYMKLAESYHMPIKKLPMKKSGNLHPHSHLPWEIGSPVQEIDVWTSFGKIMPGITKVWERKEGEILGDMDSTPDCVLVIDSSASMINPREDLSYAVLGAGCACDAYLRNGARVGVYNFSDAMMGNKALLDYSDKRDEVYSVLCKYFSGGTALSLKDIAAFLEGSDKPDVFIITDMKITNLGNLINYLKKIDNRVTAVYIGESQHVARFKRSLSDEGNINIYAVDKKEDIPKIVLGKVREYMGSR